VPQEQQPLNEYQELKESWFFRWAILDLPDYIRKLGWCWFWSWAISGPVAAASFAPTKHPLQFFLVSAAGAGLFLCLALVRLYLGWTYIHSRLSNATVFYEESGWYDGQVWHKPLEVHMRDRLVSTYQVQPILKRLQKTFAILALFLLLGSLTWTIL
jgi:hypothetical protein